MSKQPHRTQIFTWQCQCGTKQTGCVKLNFKHNNGPKVKCCKCSQYTAWQNINLLQVYPAVTFKHNNQ